MNSISRIYKRLLLILTIAFAVIVSSISLSVANIVISPTRLELENNERSTGVTIENLGRGTQVMQARVYVWDQKEGIEDWVPQNNVMISPPMVKIAPGEKQLFRIALRAPIPANTVQSYRVVIDEVPKKVDALLKEGMGEEESRHGVQFQIRYSVPLFVFGKGLSKKVLDKTTSEELAKQLRWSITYKNDKQYLKVSNSGPYPLDLSDLNFSLMSIESLGGGYILPRHSREWEFTGSAGSHLYGRINDADDKVQIAQ